MHITFLHDGTATTGVGVVNDVKLSGHDAAAIDASNSGVRQSVTLLILAVDGNGTVAKIAHGHLPVIVVADVDRQRRAICVYARIPQCDGAEVLHCTTNDRK
jgi:hypothetical protein